MQHPRSQFQQAVDDFLILCAVQATSTFDDGADAGQEALHDMSSDISDKRQLLSYVFLPTGTRIRHDGRGLLVMSKAVLSVVTPYMAAAIPSESI